MRLLDFGEKPEYYPLDRGEAFPQFHEDGDAYQIFNPMDWNYDFWLHGVWELSAGHNRFDATYLMGGEL